MGQYLAVTERWNHNVHYGHRLLELVPVGAHDALDIGCGEGWLVRELRQRVPHVVGIDADAFSIAAASASDAQDGVEYLQGDFLTWAFEPASFDIVTAVASVHHLDEKPHCDVSPNCFGLAASLASSALPGLARYGIWRSTSSAWGELARTRSARATGRPPHPKSGLRRTPTASYDNSPRSPYRADTSGAVQCSVTF